MNIKFWPEQSGQHRCTAENWKLACSAPENATSLNWGYKERRAILITEHFSHGLCPWCLGSIGEINDERFYNLRILAEPQSPEGIAVLAFLRVVYGKRINQT